MRSFIVIQAHTYKSTLTEPLEPPFSNAYLRHFDGCHGINVKTEYFGSCKADCKALQFLLMRWKISGFNAEEAVAAVAEHIFVLRIPRH